MAARIRLIALGSATLRAYPLAKPQTTIGSAPDSDVVIEHDSVSRRHAVIERRMGRYVVCDLSSTNGTRVNGRKIGGRRTVVPGDELQFGSTRFAVMNAPRRRRFAGSGVLAAAVIILIVAAAGAARYFDLNPFRTVPAAAPQSGSHTEPLASAPPAKAIDHDGAAGEHLNPAGAGSAEWLSAVNEYRTMAEVAAVRENPALSEGDFAHARYLVKNVSRGDASTEGADAHSERRGNPWFSEAGLHAAHSGDVDQWWGTGPHSVPPPRWAIDQWVSSTWHRMAILNPRLSEVGYGQFCENGACAAVLDVLSGLGPARLTPAASPEPIRFPPAGKTVAMKELGNEWPDPLTACRGYRAPVGLPVTLQLGAMVPARLEAFSLRRGSASGILEACGFDATTYVNPAATDQKAAREALTELGAVVVIPRYPLSAGDYTVEMTVNGQSYSWRFAVKNK